MQVFLILTIFHYMYGQTDGYYFVFRFTELNGEKPGIKTDFKCFIYRLALTHPVFKKARTLKTGFIIYKK